MARPQRLEIRLANIFNKETAILFPTGYTANVGALSGLARGASTIVLMDRECHASIIDGVKLAGCDYLPFKHNDLKDLEKKLLSKRQDYENVIVVVESVYSMSGVEAPIADIVALKKKYGFYLFVDEAHAFGIYHIGGLVSSLGLSDDVDFLMTTLSKSTASLGGVVATSNAFRTLLMTNANAYMFQAAMTPPDTAAVSAALDVIQSEPQIVDSLWQKTHYLREQLSVRGFDIGSGRSPIVPVYVRDPGILMDMSRELYERGIFTTSVTFPAVKHNEVRFRFIVNESHTFPQIDQTVETLTVIGKKHGLIG